MEKNQYPKVSVIIPTFNRAWCINNAIDSILEQDYQNVELIVVNDGSTDNTAEILHTYKDKILVLNQENKGVSAARNFGILESSGEYIALLDSDDLWKPGKIKRQIDFFEANPDAMICQTEEIWIRKQKRVNPKLKHKKPSGMIFEPSLHLCLVSPSAVMIKKDIFKTIGNFNENFPVCEDYDLWLRISSVIPVYLIDEPYIIKNGGHDDQLSSNHSQDKYRIQSILNLIESRTLSPVQEKAAKTVLYQKCEIYGNGCLKRGKTKEGNFYLNLKESIY